MPPQPQPPGSTPLRPVPNLPRGDGLSSQRGYDSSSESGCGVGSQMDRFVDVITSQQRSISQLIQQNAEQVLRIAALEGEAEGAGAPSIAAIASAPVPDNAAKEMIRVYLTENSGEFLYPDQIAARLGLETRQAIRLCDELFSDGQLEQASL